MFCRNWCHGFPHLSWVQLNISAPVKALNRALNRTPLSFWWYHYFHFGFSFFLHGSNASRHQFATESCLHLSPILRPMPHQMHHVVRYSVRTVPWSESVYLSGLLISAPTLTGSNNAAQMCQQKDKSIEWRKLRSQTEYYCKTTQTKRIILLRNLDNTK